MNLLTQVLIYIFITVIGCNENFLLRGVDKIKAPLYDLSKDFFKCFNSELTIPINFVNDDYCDCNDGSDEPGTSACPNGVYVCLNKGHIPLEIPSSRVNDGICDCCDGSDEYMYNHCPNTCDELNEEARFAAKERAELFKAGSELRLELSAHGKKMKEEKIERINTLENDKIEADALKAEKESIKKEAEAAEATVLEAHKLTKDAIKHEEEENQLKAEENEAESAFKIIDSDSNNKITIDELKTRDIFDQNKDTIVSDDEAQFILGAHEEISWDDFIKSGCWHRMKPFFMLKQGIFQPPATEAPFDNAASENKDDALDEEGLDENRGTKEENVVSDEEVDNGKEHPHEDELTYGEEDDEEDQEENNEQQDAEPPREVSEEYDEETRIIIDAANKARSEFEEAERAIRNIEREISDLNNSLNKDYGYQDEFAPLVGECFEYADREYVYKLCPFDQVTQRSAGGGAETRLGSWQSWLNDGNETYSLMLYDQGQPCWNGPQRQTRVRVGCGLKNAVVYANEPNRCEYELDFITPAACWLEKLEKIEYENGKNFLHDEL